MKNYVRTEFMSSIEAANGFDAVMLAASAFHPLSSREAQFLAPFVKPNFTNPKTIKRYVKYARIQTVLQNYQDNVLDKKFPGVSEDLLRTAVDNKEKFAEFSEAITVIENIFRERQNEERLKRDEAKRHAAIHEFHRNIKGLTPAKAMDEILRNKKYWENWKDVVEAGGVLWVDVQVRERKNLERKAAADARAALKAEAQRAELEILVSRDPLDDIGITSTFDKSDTKYPVILTIKKDVFYIYDEPELNALIFYAIKDLFTGFRDYSGPDRIRTFCGSRTSWMRLVENKAQVEKDLRSIIALEPKFLRTLNRKEAAGLCGMSQAAFDEAVDKRKIPVAGFEEFRKWGKTLHAKCFQARDLISFRDDRQMDAFLAGREARIAARRKNASSKAKVTREMRQALAEQISREDRLEVHNLTVKEKDLRAGLYLELFRWAQRASRLAKTRSSDARAAYDLKDDALVCLFENGALDVSFVPSPRTYIIQKCDMHSHGWYDIFEIEDCRDCKTATSNSYSLYALSLKVCPQAGTLHMPYPSGILSGFPKIEDLEAADHDRDVCYGRKLDKDETSLFPLKELCSKVGDGLIRRLFEVA